MFRPYYHNHPIVVHKRSHCRGGVEPTREVTKSDATDIVNTVEA